MNITKETTAKQLAEYAHDQNPSVIYQAANNDGSVAAWSGRWIPVAGRVIGSNDWYNIGSELLVDGKPAFDPSLYGPAPLTSSKKNGGK